jgi:hypothetical protein
VTVRLCEVGAGLAQLDQHYLHAINDMHDILGGLLAVLVFIEKDGIFVIFEHMSAAVFVSDICHFAYTENLR